MAADNAVGFPQAFIDTLPDELLSRIFTIGCEKDLADPPAFNELDFYPFLVEDPFADEYDIQHTSLSGTKAPKRLTRNILLTCRRWYGVAIMPSNAHLWMARVSLLGGTTDAAIDFTRFILALKIPGEQI